MDSPRGLSKPTDTNRRTGKKRKICQERTLRQPTMTSTKATTSTTEERMEGSGNNFNGNLQGSLGQMDNNQLMLNMHSPMNTFDQGMQMTPPHAMIPGTSHFQVPMPLMTGAYHQAMFPHPGQFHGHFAASPQFVPQGYAGGNDQGQKQPTEEGNPENGNEEEDEVEEVVSHLWQVHRR